MDRQELISELIRDTQLVKSEVEAMVAQGEGVLNHKPAPDKWSVLECIEHLNIADAHYLWQFEQKLPKAKIVEKSEFSPGMLGNYFVKVIKPREDGSIPSPMKTMQKFRPEIKAQYDTVNQFLKDQDSIVEYLEISRKLDLNKNKITSAIGRIITFKLGDAFRFLIGHNQRHVIQMKNVIKVITPVEV